MAKLGLMAANDCASKMRCGFTLFQSRSMMAYTKHTICPIEMDEENSMTSQLQRQEAEQTFERDLPRLLQEHPGEWVAYRGQERVVCARHTHDIYETCLRLGLAPDQIVIFQIIPADEEMILNPMAFD